MIIADGAVRDHNSLLRRGKREGETIVKFKLLLVSLVYLIAVYLLASPSCIGILLSGHVQTYFDTVAKEIREVGLAIAKDIDYYIRPTK